MEDKTGVWGLNKIVKKIGTNFEYLAFKWGIMQRPKMGFNPNLGSFKHYNYSKHKARFIYKKRRMRSLWLSAPDGTYQCFTFTFKFHGATEMENHPLMYSFRNSSRILILLRRFLYINSALQNLCRGPLNKSTISCYFSNSFLSLKNLYILSV